MIELSVSLASSGVVKVPGYEQLVRFGYTKNRGMYRLAVTAAGEWEGLTIRAFWHVPDGKDPASSLVVDGYLDVPASVTAQPGNGCVTFEGSDGSRTVTSADLRYRVSANSGTEDGTVPLLAPLHGSSWWMPCTPMPPPQSRPRPMHRRQPTKLPPVRAMQTGALRRPLTACRS
jgi:hypothetical protein